MARARVPRLVVTAWLVSAAVLVAVGLAAAQLLNSDTHSHMSMGVADALARGGTSRTLPSLSGARLFTAWQLDTVAVALLVLVAAAYLTGVALVPVRQSGERWPLRRTAYFFAGLVVCAFATNGSIAVYDQSLFTAHMAGHLALVMVAPALLVAGEPLTLAIAAASPARRRRLEKAAHGRVVALLTAPPVALATYALVIVGSHLSGVMNTIMSNTWAGQVEHLVYLFAGCQFFVLVVADEPIRWRLGAPARWLLLAIAMAVDTFTGIVLMQGTHPVELVNAGFAVDALSDTQTGGAVMWFGGDAIMLVMMIVLVVKWLRAAGTAPVEQSWLEQARGAAFATHTESDVDTVDDEDDAARAAYNAWLGRLAERK